MTREYRLPGGELVPSELQDQIASDVRAFDASQAPAARAAVQLRKIASDIPRVRGALADLADAIREANRINGRVATALELQTLADLGYTPRQLRDTDAGRSLINSYGLGDPDWPAAPQTLTIKEKE